MTESSRGAPSALNSCPLLGVPADPRTHYSFPHEAHRCHARQRPAPIDAGWQGTHCLTARHPECERFQAWRAAGGVAIGAAAGDGMAGTGGARGGLAAGAALPAVNPVQPLRPPGRRPQHRPGRGRARLGAALAGSRRPLLAVALALVVVVAAVALSPLLPGYAPPSGPGFTLPPTAPPVASPSSVAEASPTAVATTAPSAPATEVPTSSAVPSPSRRVHVVQPGEWLSSIAEQYGTTVEELIDLNDIEDPNVIDVGEEILLPPG